MSSKKIKIKDVAQLINGHAFKPTDRSNKGLKIIRIQNLNNPLANYNQTEKEVANKYLVNKGDILIAWSASLGVYEWKQEKALLNQHIFKVEFISDDILKHYFKYIVQLAFDELLYKMRGVGLKHLTKKQLDDYEFNLPELQKQEQIVKILDSIEILINQRKDSIKLLDEYKKAIFLNLFLDNQASKKWKSDLINNLDFSFIYGTAKKANTDNVGIPILRMNNISSSGEINLDKLKYVLLEDKEKERLKLNSRDVLFNRTNSRDLVGKSAVWNKGDGYTFAGYLVKIIVNEKIINPYYLVGFLNSNHGKKILFNKAQIAGNLANFSPKLIKQLKILIPPINLQKKYEGIVVNCDNQKAQYGKSLTLLEELFQSVLYKSFGKLDDESEEDAIDFMMSDELRIQKFLDDVKKGEDYESLRQYDIYQETLFNILERTEQKNQDEEGFKKGIVQFLNDENEIELITNREYRLREE